MLNLEYREEQRVTRVAIIADYRVEIYYSQGRHYWSIYWFDRDVASGWTSDDFGARIRIEEVIEEHQAQVKETRRRADEAFLAAIRQS
jgi:hypothetical protein